MNIRISSAQALLAAGTIATTSVIAVTGASSASAHMGIELRGSTPTAGSSSTIMFRPGHGCDGDATNALSVEIPDGVTGVKPQQKAGWKLSTSNNGKTITWSGGALPDDQFEEFGIRMTWPKAAAGSAAQKYYFKTVQTCNAELKVATKSLNATITGFLPSFAGQKVALFVGDTPLTVRDVTIGTDGKFSVSTKAAKVPAEAEIFAKIDGRLVGTSKAGAENWIEIPAAGSTASLANPAPVVTVVAPAAATTSGH
ncbi:MAG: DUF1775 domain-containing protein [Candidatus Nanopelagicales bacterium]